MLVKGCPWRCLHQKCLNSSILAGCPTEYRYVLPVAWFSPPSELPAGRQWAHVDKGGSTNTSNPNIISCNKLPGQILKHNGCKKTSHWLVAGVEAEAEAEALSSSSLSSSLDCGTSASGMVVVGVSGSCSALLFRAKIRWCNAAANWPMSLELPWRREREKSVRQTDSEWNCRHTKSIQNTSGRRGPLNAPAGGDKVGELGSA